MNYHRQEQGLNPLKLSIKIFGENQKAAELPTVWEIKRDGEVSFNALHEHRSETVDMIKIR
jgi:hypothetical protein